MKHIHILYHVYFASYNTNYESDHQPILFKINVNLLSV